MAVIPKALRELVVRRANGLCEYCQTAQTIVIEIEVDHIIPESAGGLTTEENLCLACVSCNSYKNAAQIAPDPESGDDVPLYNPRTQKWKDHFRWSEEGTRLIGRTSTGRATVERLKINREIVVQARERWVKAGWHPPKVL